MAGMQKLDVAVLGATGAVGCSILDAELLAVQEYITGFRPAPGGRRAFDGGTDR